jgi:hypothetical protein
MHTSTKIDSYLLSAGKRHVERSVSRNHLKDMSLEQAYRGLLSHSHSEQLARYVVAGYAAAGFAGWFGADI